MKAAVLHGKGDMRYEDIPEPDVLPGTVKIKVMASGICGSDIPRVLEGKAHFFPLVLGHEFSGIVTQTGEGVASLAVGDHVAGVPLVPCFDCDDCRAGNYALCKNYSFIGSRQQGSFAEYVVVPDTNAVSIDPSIPFEQGALFEPSAVALHGIRLLGPVAGKSVAVLGAGTIGYFTVQWARILGASQVVVFSRTPRKLEQCRNAGADASVNTALEDPVQSALKLTGGRGFDLVMETAGSTETMKLAFELAGNKAGVCLVGTPKEELVFPPALWEKMNRKEFVLTGSWMSYSEPFPGDEWTLTAECFADGRLRMDEGILFRKYPLSRAAEAFALYEGGGGSEGKILLVNE